METFGKGEKIVLTPTKEDRMTITPRETVEGLAPIPASAISTLATGSKMLFLSGQTGQVADGSVAGPDFKSQASQALRTIKTALAANDAKLSDVAKIVFYIVDWNQEKLGPLMESAIEVFGDEFPLTSTTLIGVAALFEPEFLIEIDVTAVVD
jgi:enamine deaminase RidA (YjgF/YER057c/UK114 family)